MTTLTSRLPLVLAAGLFLLGSALWACGGGWVAGSACYSAAASAVVLAGFGSDGDEEE